MENGISRDERGNYRWVGVIDRGYEMKTFRIAFGVVGGICAFFAAASLFLGGDAAGVTLLSCAGALAVTGGVCWLFGRRAGRRTQAYVLTEDAVLFPRRKTSAPILFRSVRKAVVCPSREMIELRHLGGSAPVFAPPGGFAFVRDYILERLPPDATVLNA